MSVGEYFFPHLYSDSEQREHWCDLVKLLLLDMDGGGVVIGVRPKQRTTARVSIRFELWEQRSVGHKVCP